MRLTLTVVYADESTADAVVSAVDFVRFEEKYDRSVARFEKEMRFTDLCWLAWHSLHRKKATSVDFDQWLDTIESVEFTDNEKDEIVPLESQASTG